MVNKAPVASSNLAEQLTDTPPVPASTFRRLLQNPSGVLGVAIVFLSMLFAFVAPLFYRVDPYKFNAKDRLAFFSWRMPMGGDEVGRDLLARVMSGTRTSLYIAVTSVTIAVVVGTLIGLLAAYYGGWVDSFLMRLMDVGFAFPAILLALLLIAILGPSSLNLIVALGLVFIPGFARIARAPALKTMRMPFVELLQATGASSWRIVTRHLVPNSFAPVVVQAAVALSYVILIEAALSYLGLGVPPPTPSLGGIINRGQQLLHQAPWVCFGPAVVLAIVIAGFNLLGDGLSDILDTRSE